MSKTILVPLAGILAIAVVYLFYAFSLWQINPAQWGVGGRAGCAMFAAIFGIAGAMFAEILVRADERAKLAEQPAQEEPVLQQIEQYRLQMAAICTAAIGYWKEGDGIGPDYDTVALRDVAKLYAKYDEQAKLKEKNT